MKWISLILLAFFCYSCWKKPLDPYVFNFPQKKVWGNKPIYAAQEQAKKIEYIPGKQPVVQPGNIYTYGKYIFQLDFGTGIHVIDNSNPSKADRIGFIKINGCAQISIKNNFLYTNSISDLVTIDISTYGTVKEVSRITDAFLDYKYTYPLSQPLERGYYKCPNYDSVVIGWVKDSIYANCIK